ncbi:MAG: 4Fe-4S dicluster domain-containing protein [Phycisphaerae bacterium]|nr:4Fe-4S dicluster domain-containing protein [Phycisphaerae bacterium]
MPEDKGISRRDLFRWRWPGRAAEIPGAARPVSDPAEGEARAEPSSGRSGIGRRFALPIHRPPGAVDEVAFLAGCTKCGECATACPVGAIVFAPARFREAAGTPMIEPHTAACIMCPDTPCISACKPGVLRKDRSLKMAVATIQPMACLAYTGSFCSVCSERCPVPGAIEVTKGKPRIREDVCTGCGVCANVCPAPENAVMVLPLADRPIKTSDPTPPGSGSSVSGDAR